MSDHDRTRWFRVTFVLRSGTIAVLAVIAALLSDEMAQWVGPLIVVSLSLGLVSGWVTYRRHGIVPPWVWLGDLIAVGLFAAIDPAYSGPAVMVSLLVVGFAHDTMRRDSALLLTIVSVLAMVPAGLVVGGRVGVATAIFYSMAAAMLVRTSVITSATLLRAQSFTDRTAASVRLCLFESRLDPQTGHWLFDIYGNFDWLGVVDGRTTLTEAMWQEILHPDDRWVSEEIDAAVNSAQDYRVRYRQRSLDGSYKWIEEVGHIQGDDHGHGVRVHGVVHDITELAETDAERARYGSMVEGLPVAVVVLQLVDDADPTSLTFVYINARGREQEEDHVVGRRLVDTLPDAFSTDGHRGIGLAIARAAAEGPPALFHDVSVRIGGRQRIVSLHVNPLSEGYVTLAFHDVTDLAETRAELVRLAYFDALTDLPNRIRLRQLIDEAPIGSLLAVLDLDRFTEINDAFGHRCGDEVIIEVARTLAGGPGGGPGGSVTARLGGDEFGILVPPGSFDQEVIGQRISLALARPVVLPNGLALQTSASIGLATKTKDGMSSDELLRQADVAMHRAKRFRSGHESYDAQQDTSAPHRMMLLGEIRRAIRKRELELHYQPIVDVATGTIQRVEGVLRWRHPSLGMLPPDDFIDMMELSHLNRDIVMYCLDVAIAQHRQWRTRGHVMPISINVSGATVHDSDLVSGIIGVIGAAAVGRGVIGIELAERQLLLGSGISDESMHRLREAGVWLAIDHFGTGASPLAGLRHIRADALKIDRTLIDDLRSGDGALIRGIVSIAHNLGMLLEAEGVDDELSARWLRANGADRMQGTHVAALATATEVEAVFASPSPTPLAL